MTKPLSYWAQRSIHKFKAWICTFKAWFFTLNLKCVLNSVDFSLRSKWQNPPSLRASKASVAIQKVKITLNLWIATPFSQKRLAMTRLLSYWAQRSIQEWNLTMWFFYGYFDIKSQYDKVGHSLFYPSLRAKKSISDFSRGNLFDKAFLILWIATLVLCTRSQWQGIWSIKKLKM